MQHEISNSEIGDRLKSSRAGESQQSFAARFGIKQAAYSTYELGKNEIPLWALVAIAEGTSTNFQWLIFGDGRQPREPLVPLTRPGAVSESRPPVADRRLAAAITALAEEYQAMNEHGRTSLLRRFWKAFPELDTENASGKDRRVAGLSRA